MAVKYGKHTHTALHPEKAHALVLQGDDTKRSFFHIHIVRNPLSMHHYMNVHTDPHTKYTKVLQAHEVQTCT